MTLTTRNFIIALILLPLFTIGCTGNGSDSDLPSGCVSESYEFNGKNLVLSEISSKQSLFLFHNVSSKGLLLNHPVGKDPGASAGWASSLSAGKWSALAINGSSTKIENFEITCSTMDDSGKLDYLDCRNIIKTCRVENPVFSSGDSGSYWVSEDKPLNDLLDAIKSRGINW